MTDNTETPKKNSRTPAREFIEIWQSSSSQKEVCERTGLKSASAYTRARGYRARGILLKEFEAARNDWAGLRELARSLLSEEDLQKLEIDETAGDEVVSA